MCNTKTILLLSNFLLLTSASPAISVEGVTHQRMHFKGIIRKTSDGIIELSGSVNQSEQHIGIPISNIAKLQPVPGISSDQEMERIFHNQSILHLWDAHTHNSLIGHLETMASNSDWSDCYHGATRLEPVVSDQSQKQRIHLVKAWALFEMGMASKAQVVLDEMDLYLDQQSAPVRYCWLKAKLAGLSDDAEMATFWSLLPLLRIPSDTSDLALQLYGEFSEPDKSS